MTTATSNPYDDAMTTEWAPRPKVFFGQVEVDSYYCALIKGQGKVQFDPAQHKAEQRCTAITIAILPLPDSPISNSVDRQMIAESKEWSQIVKPSLKALNTDLRSIAGKWAQVEMVSTGRTYENKSGETKQSTTFKFIAVYPSEHECVAAADRFFAKVSGPHQDAPETAPAPQAATTNNSAERQTAAKFLPALWMQAGKDLAKFADLLQKYPLVAKHFTIDSPEVLALIAPF